MQNKYQVKIDDSVLPELYSFDQLIDAGLLDEYDEKIKVRLNGDSVWQTARSFPFADLEQTTRDQQRNNAIDDNSTAQSDEIRTIGIHQNDGMISRHRHTQNSSQRIQIEYPPIVDKWNWGAFSLSWLWGIFNGLYWPLIIIAFNFIPYIGFIISLCICFLLGNRGNEIAWRIARRKGVSVDYFTDLQTKWNVAGVFVTILAIGCAFIFLVFSFI